MNLEKIKTERHELLTRMRDSLQEDLVACGISEPEGEDEPEILEVVVDGIGEAGELEGGLGEFFFVLPSSEDDTVMHFCCVITLLDELDKECLPKLFEAMSYANFELPLGSYSVDREASILCYKLVTPLPITLSGEDLYEQMNISMANAIASAEMYADELIRAAGKESTPD